MLFSLISALFFENNARNTRCMSVLIFKKCLDLRKNIYSRTSSWRKFNRHHIAIPEHPDTLIWVAGVKPALDCLPSQGL